VQRVKPSPTLAVTALAAKLKAEGKDIISLGAGEPDFDTPVHIADAGVAAIRSGFTRYTNVDGIPELKDAIIAKFKRDNGISYARNQVLVSTGAKQTIFNLCMAVLDSGDEVVIPAPYWVSYPDMAMLADGVPVMPSAGPDQDYKISPKQLAAAITPKTRLFLLNSPSNPTGAAYTAAELRALADVLVEHPRVLIGTDDMYEKIYWGAEPFASLLTVAPELYDRTVTINGVSKAYAMTGWRIGYCGGPKEIITAMGTIQGQSTSNAASMCQKAAAAALNGDQECVTVMVKAFKERHDYFVAALNTLPGVSCRRGAGTFYAFADVRKAMANLGVKDDSAFAEYLIHKAGVAVVAGSGFGAPGHIRMSFACSRQTLEMAIERMQAALSQADAA
jgi:aspartate aminotransferase